MSKISNLISIEIFLTCMSFMAGIIIYISQYGFIQDIKLISFSILISLYLIYFPNFIKKNFEFFKIIQNIIF